MDEQLELIALIGYLMFTSSKVAGELSALARDARANGTPLLKAELHLDEWFELTSDLTSRAQL